MEDHIAEAARHESNLAQLMTLYYRHRSAGTALPQDLAYAIRHAEDRIRELRKNQPTGKLTIVDQERT
ncbi:MAG TPA: hypothetical protein VF974_01425 [Patescibacteria group bacterium]